MPRLLRAWLAPCRIIIHGDLGGHWRTRPVWLLLGWLAPWLIALALLGYWQTSFTRMHTRIVQHNEQLAQRNAQLNKQIARAEARAMVAEAESKQLRDTVQQQQRELIPLRERLSLLETILLKRRGKGTHLLSASANWQGKQLVIRVVLVKSGNYPREVSGKVVLLAPTPKGDMLSLPPVLDFRMETHAILHHAYAWQQPWRPKQLFAILKNAHGHELERITIWIGGKDDQALSTMAPAN